MAEIPPTRASLLVRLRDPRDEAAWREFVDLYTPLVYGYARKQGLQDADAADLSQEVLTAVAGAVGRLQYDPRRGAFHNWLFKVVRRKLSNWRAARKNRTRGSGDTAIQEFLEQYPAPGSVEAPPPDGNWHWQLFVAKIAGVKFVDNRAPKTPAADGAAITAGSPLKLGDHINVKVHDLITDEQYTWTQEWNYVELDPYKMPFHLFKVAIHESYL